MIFDGLLFRSQCVARCFQEHHVGAGVPLSATVGLADVLNHRPAISKLIQFKHYKVFTLQRSLGLKASSCGVFKMISANVLFALF